MMSKDKEKKFENARKSYQDIREKYGRFFKGIVVDESNIQPPWDINNIKQNQRLRQKTGKA